MKLRADQLVEHLHKAPPPIYLVSGDEPLQVMEACDAVRAYARTRGCGERLVFDAGSGFDWNSLLAERDALSLFSSRRLIELRLPSGKPGTEGGKALSEYAARPPPDDILLITTGKLDKDAQASKWFAALDRAGAVVQVWPVEPRELPDWIERRCRAHGLQPTPEAVRLLAERAEGNLLACAQEIEKLLLLRGAGPVDETACAEAVAGSARYSIYDLADRALAGEAAQAARMLAGLRAEGEDAILVLWALAREIRALAQMASALRRGNAMEQVIGAHRVWDKRKPLVRSALKRYRAGIWYGLLRQAGRIDRVIKGQAAGDPWDELLQLALAIAGVPLMRAAARR